MTKTNYIYEYYQKITDGSITVGKWILLLYKRIIEGLENKSFYYSQKKAQKAIAFIENFCHHHEGALAPQLFKLELWQKALISVIFGIVDEDGLRVFREVLAVIGRKNGKTLLDAAIAEYMFFLDGEQGARIYFVAPKLQQANLAYDALFQMIKREPELDEIAHKRRTDIYIEATNSSAQPLAFNAKKSDGLNPSFCSCDEIASWQGEQGLKQYEVIKSAVGARTQPLIFSISTAGYINEGIYDELMKRATRFLLGDSNERRLCPFLYIIDDITKWNDINELQKSNPNLGVSITVDYLLEEIAIAEGSLSKKTEFLTKYCNIKQNSSQAWLSDEAVRGAMGDALKLEDFDHCYGVVGVDLSQTTDLTAAVCLIERNGIINCFAKFFLPAERIEEATERDGLPYSAYVTRGLLQLSGDNYIDYHDVEDWITQLKKYNVATLRIGYDRYSAQYLIQDLNGKGYKTDDVYQGDNLYPVLQEFEGLLKDGRINIGDNDLLAVHLLNSAIKMSVERGRGKLVKIAPTKHIDGTAALIDALTVRQKDYKQIGKLLANEGR